MKKTSEMWSHLYMRAILETDHRKRRQRIKEAERAIRDRLSGTLPIDACERQILEAARNKLSRPELH
jgi:hypothetical protein